MFDTFRKYFYLFVIGFGLSIIHVPSFFFWEDYIGHVGAFIHKVGFIIAIISGILFMFEVFKRRSRL